MPAMPSSAPMGSVQDDHEAPAAVESEGQVAGSSPGLQARTCHVPAVKSLSGAAEMPAMPSSAPAGSVQEDHEALAAVGSGGHVAGLAEAYVPCACCEEPVRCRGDACDAELGTRRFCAGRSRSTCSSGVRRPRGRACGSLRAMCML